MKRLILILLVFAAAGCGTGSKRAADLPAGSDLRADISYRAANPGRHIEAVFYFSSPTAPGVKTSPPREAVSVEDPTFNGSPMTTEKSDSGDEMYKFTESTPAKESTITAKLNGKVFEGKVTMENLAGNRMTSVTLIPKQ